MCRRHPRLRLRKPQVSSAPRVQGITKINVAKFFYMYGPMLWLINFRSHQLFKLRRNALNVVQHKECKVISLHGERRISLSSAERGSLVTIVTCMNATVNYVPLLLVFPRSNMKAAILDSPPPGSMAACHRAGRSQKGFYAKVQTFCPFCEAI